MGRLLIPVFGIACLLAGCGGSPQPAKTVAPQPEVAEETDSILGALGYIDEELLIEAFPDADPDVIADLLEQLDAATLEELEELDQLLIGVDPGDLEAIAEELEASDLIESVQKNYLYEPDPTSDEPLQTAQENPDTAGGAAARGVASNPDAITIAIVDSGIDAAHPALTDRIVGGWNVFANSPDFGDVTGHGTAVAVIAASAAGGQASIPRGAMAHPLLAVRVTDNKGRASSHDLAAGILWAVNHGANVINVSFTPQPSDAIVRLAAKYAWSRGVIVVIGNGGNGIGIARHVDGRFVHASGHGNESSAPMLTSALAFVWSANPQLRPVTVTDALFGPATKPDEIRLDDTNGSMPVDAVTAANEASLIVFVADTSPPQVSIMTPPTGAVLHGRVPVQVNAKDDWGVAEVAMYLDDFELATDVRAPFRFLLNTHPFAAGMHDLWFVATDSSGNVGEPVRVRVSFEGNSFAVSDSHVK